MAMLYFAVVLCLASVASAGVGVVAPVAAVAPIAVDSYAVPQYSFSYDVADKVTGDQHGRWEARDGPLTKGGYSLVEADGSLRVVDYVSDPINGFNAQVKKVGPTLHGGYAAAPIVTAAAPVVAAPGLGYGGVGYGGLGAATPLLAAPGLGYASGLGYGSGLGYAGGLGYARGLGYAGGIGYGSGLGYAGGLGYARGLGYAGGLGYGLGPGAIYA